MLSIVGFHVINNGVMHPEHPLRMGDNNFFIAVILNSFFVVAVNCFVLISGYFSIHATKEKFVKLYGMVLTYSVLLSFGFAIYHYMSGSAVNYVQLVKSFIPVISNQWWFFTAYIILFLCAPILNLAINNFTKKQMSLLLVIALFLFVVAPSIRMPIQLGRGFHFTHFIVLYLVGAYIKKYIRLPRAAVSAFVWLLTTSAIVAFMLLLDKVGMNHGYVSASWAYNNVLVVVAAVALVAMFMKLNLGSHKVINGIASMVFGVYLLHEQPDVKSILYNDIFHCDQYYDSSAFVGNLLFTCVCVFLAGIIFEYIRSKTIAKPVERLMMTTMNYVSKRVDKLKFFNK